MEFPSVRAMDPVCPVSMLLNQKIDEMGIFKNISDSNKDAYDSDFVELIKNRVFAGMEISTNVKRYEEQLLELNKTFGLATVQPNENPFRLTELDKRFQKGGDFEELNILEARYQLGFDENELTMINFPNEIQFVDEQSFKNHNNAAKLKKVLDGKRFAIDTRPDTFKDYEKIVFRYFINRFRLSQKYHIPQNEGTTEAMRPVSDDNLKILVTFLTIFKKYRFIKTFH